MHMYKGLIIHQKQCWFQSDQLYANTFMKIHMLYNRHGQSAALQIILAALRTFKIIEMMV